MKNLVIITLLFLCSCKATAPTASLQEEAIVMKIVCRSDNTLKQDLLYRLRFGKGRGIIVEDQDGAVRMEATFSLSEVALYKVQDLETDLKAVTGVISVDLAWSRIPVDPNRPPANARVR